MMPMPNPLAVGLVQMRCEPDPEANLDKAVAQLRTGSKGWAACRWAGRWVGRRWRCGKRSWTI
jgi:hypothetical protein